MAVNKYANTSSAAIPIPNVDMSVLLEVSRTFTSPKSSIRLDVGAKADVESTDTEKADN